MNQLTPAVSQNDHIQGDASAPVTLVEYGDFECSYCAQAYTIVQSLQKEMGDQLRFVFRNFPLPEIHPNAMGAAEFAEEAGLQNNFWQAHDWLYQHQNALDPASLRHKSQSRFLNTDQMERDQPKAHARVMADMKGAVQSGVQGTPTFFINGQLFDGAWDYNSLLSALQNAAAREPVSSR